MLWFSIYLFYLFLPKNLCSFLSLKNIISTGIFNFFHLSFHFYVHERHLFAFSSFSSPMCISVHHIHAVPLEGVRSLGTIATDGCELGRGCPESNHIQLNSGHL